MWPGPAVPAAEQAAEQAAADAVRSWADVLGEDRLRALSADLARLAPNGPVRPAW